jgi:hypothetical protein
MHATHRRCFLLNSSFALAGVPTSSMLTKSASAQTVLEIPKRLLDDPYWQKYQETIDLWNEKKLVFPPRDQLSRILDDVINFTNPDRFGFAEFEEFRSTARQAFDELGDMSPTKQFSQEGRFAVTAIFLVNIIEVRGRFRDAKMILREDGTMNERFALSVHLLYGGAQKAAEERGHDEIGCDDSNKSSFWGWPFNTLFTW